MHPQDLLNSPAGLHWQKIGFGNHHGIVIPLFSLHSKNSCGIGEYPDLISIINWCKEIGFDIIQLLPLNDTGLETSPYSALSAFALNPIHLGLSQLPHLVDDMDLQNQIQELQSLTNKNQRLDYKTIQSKRNEFLYNYSQKYGSFFAMQPAYEAFKKKNEYWLSDYAAFKTLKIEHGWTNWEEWSPEYQNPTSDFFKNLTPQFSKKMEYHSLIQFLCFQQFIQVKNFAEEENVYLKGDIPILINRQSTAEWRYPEQFMLEFAAGAPPDMYSKEGQKWGFPLYRWDVMAADNYRWWKERLNTAMQFYDIYRIDHVVGFFRIWGIPIDKEAKCGHFFPQDEKQWIPQGETIMRFMLENCPMLPIGEDLGTVPIEVRECLSRLGISGTKVMRWERYWQGDQSYINPKDYPPASMTTVSTHDSQTLKLWWKNEPEEAELYAASRGWTYSPELTKQQHFDILAASHASSSLFHINLLQEYLALIPGMTWPKLEDERINLPGIISDNNWSYRFLPSLEEIIENEELKQIIRKLAK
jgi:4-alpha-glucanotransferase